MNNSSKKNIKDSVYGSYLIGKMINVIMLAGKKSTAEKIVYKAVDLLMSNTSVKGNGNPCEVIDKIIGQVMPLVEVVSRRVRGSTVPVPSDINTHRGQSLALRWIRDNARKKKGSMVNGLSNELLEAFEGRGASMKQREQMHSMAKANKAFAHFAKKSEG